jgi:hypothetical protein
MEFVHFKDNIFFDCRFCNDEPNNKIEINIYLPETNKYYICNFLNENITIDNTNLMGIYTMLINALESKQNYLIKLEIKDFRLEISYSNEIFKFVQVINLCQNYNTDIINLKYKSFENKQKINLINKNFVPIEKFNELVKQIDELKLSLNTLKNDFDEFKKK